MSEKRLTPASCNLALELVNDEVFATGERMAELERQERLLPEQVEALQGERLRLVDRVKQLRRLRQELELL